MEKQQENKVVPKRAEVLLSLNHLWTDRGKRNRGDLIQRRQGPRSPRLPADQAKPQPLPLFLSWLPRRQSPKSSSLLTELR